MEKEKKKRFKKRKWNKNDTELTILALPTTIWYILFSFLPMFGLIIAFKDYRIISGHGFIYNVFHSDWAGFKNFEFLIKSNDLWVILRNTIIYNLAFIVLGTVLAVALAIMISELWSKRKSKVYQTLMFFPYFISWVVLGGIFIDMLSPSSGIVNRIITMLGGDSIFFLGDNRYFQPTLIVTDIWKNFGYGAIVYLAAILTIDTDLYEAAQIDGANRWQQTWHVTLPGMRMIIVLMLVLSLGNVLNAGFDQVFNMYSTAVYESGDILDTFVYRLGLIDAQYGPATAVGLFKSVISTVFISVSYFLAYKFADYRIF